MKITIETKIARDIQPVWEAWNDPRDIVQWNAASDDWHTPRSEVDLRVGGRMCSRMEAKDGSMGFDFEATFTRIEPHRLIEYVMPDQRVVSIRFEPEDSGVRIVQTFDAEDTFSPEQQQQGWQAILDNFRRHVEKD